MRLIRVTRDLGFQLVQIFKFPFVADAMDEAHLDVLPVEIALKVER
jgi:hypothetical protein